jgi:hypothetical protein
MAFLRRSDGRMRGCRARCVVRRIAAGRAEAGGREESAASACDRAVFRVVVDVGHTAESPGRRARGIWEYDFNPRWRR